MANEFEKQKYRSLNQVDLSKKGSIDEHITDLVKYINNLENYFTTSSCSGRICIFSEDKDQKKKSGKWLFVSHDLVTFDEVLTSAQVVTEGDAIFKFEPLVLHIQCRMLEDAQTMLKIALESGYKNSGIIIGKKHRYILAVRSPQSLDIPIIHHRKLMVSNEYIQYIVDLANIKMEENLSKIRRFFENVQRNLLNRAADTYDQKGRYPYSKHQKTEQYQEKRNLSRKSLNSEKVKHDDMEDVLDLLEGFYDHF